MSLFTQTVFFTSLIIFVALFLLLWKSAICLSRRNKWNYPQDAKCAPCRTPSLIFVSHPLSTPTWSSFTCSNYNVRAHLLHRAENALLWVNFFVFAVPGWDLWPFLCGLSLSLRMLCECGKEMRGNLLWQKIFSALQCSVFNNKKQFRPFPVEDQFYSSVQSFPNKYYLSGRCSRFLNIPWYGNRLFFSAFLSWTPEKLSISCIWIWKTQKLTWHHCMNEDLFWLFPWAFPIKRHTENIWVRKVHLKITLRTRLIL